MGAKAKIAIDQLPEFKPSTNLREACENNLEIQRICADNDYATRTPVITISGHVDSGKSTCTFWVLYRSGKIKQEDLEDIKKVSRERNQGELEENLQVAKCVEKGKEAKNRGMTIETNIHRIKMPIVLVYDITTEADRLQRTKDTLTYLNKEFEETKDGNLVTIKYDREIDIIDCPGHKNYIHNTAAAINGADIQYILYPSTAGDDDVTFMKIFDMEQSLSMAHTNMGVANGKQICAILSKSDSAPDRIAERTELIKTNLRKKLGIKEAKLAVIPTANVKDECANMITPTTNESVKMKKPEIVELLIPDYRTSTNKVAVTVPLTNAFDVVRYFPPMISHTGLHDNKGVMFQINTLACTDHGSVIVGCVLNGCLQKDDVIKSTQNGQEFKIDDMEQFKTKVNRSACGSHIGIKLKPLDRKNDPKLLKQGDLLCHSYPADNLAQFSKYWVLKILYTGNKSAGKKKEYMRKIGNSALLILSSRLTFQICHVYSSKRTQKGAEQVVHSDAAPIKEWPSGCVIECLVEFSKEVSTPSINQSMIHSTGCILEHHKPVGTAKIMRALSCEEGDKLNQKKIESDNKKAAKAAAIGKKKK